MGAGPAPRLSPPAAPLYAGDRVGRRRHAVAHIDRSAEPPRPLPAVDTRVERLPKLGAFEVRPMSPADHEAYCAFAAKLERDDLRLRFAGFVKLDCADLRAQLLAIDHAQHEALAAFGGGEMLAIG